jgi:hypothetical protein
VPSEAGALRDNLTVLRRKGELTDIQVGDVIHLEYPDAHGGMSTTSPNQFVIDRVATDANLPSALNLCLRDAARNEKYMHDLLIQIGPLDARNFSITLGRKALYRAFTAGMKKYSKREDETPIALLTSPRRGAISASLENIASKHCTIQRINADVPDMIVCKTNESPTVVEKGVFRSDVGLLAKQGDCADLQVGDIISIRRLLEFMLDKLAGNYWLSCVNAPSQVKSLAGRSFKLGPDGAQWKSILSRGFCGVQTPLLSSQHGIIEHDPERGFWLTLPKDQSTLWIGIKRESSRACDGSNTRMPNAGCASARALV